EAQSVVASIGIPILPEKILLMPEGVSMEVMRTRYTLLIKACLNQGYRLSPRLHIELFGNKRGT
ncbi:MAG: radical SAM protein, partial [Verrucomicrobia bacterium]|nr:radical SAM protein [Verrucomicrobiota bacterium]